MSTNITFNEEIIDVRDLIERAEEIEQEITEFATEKGIDADDVLSMGLVELADLGLADDLVCEAENVRNVLSEICGNGGDHQWRGDWYPLTLIHDSHFVEHAQELAHDCGLVVADAAWPNNCIDWDAAAELLQQDYTSIDIDGETYWYR